MGLLGGGGSYFLLTARGFHTKWARTNALHGYGLALVCHSLDSCVGTGEQS